MPIRWSTPTKASSPLLRAVLSSVTKSSPHHPRSTLPTSSAKSQLKTSARSFQSTPKPNIFQNLNSLASVSKSIALAGTGTFMSTLFALYLATKVETLAHETLYEYCPSKYYSIAEEDLPSCVKDKEMIRRRTGQIKSERVKGRVWDDSYMSLDGWVIPDREGVGASELLAEEALEEENSKMTSWQRKMTEKRAGIIEQEEKEFKNVQSRGSWPLWGDNGVVSSGVAVNKQLMERKKLQEDMTKRFQESLMSAAMTA